MSAPSTKMPVECPQCGKQLMVPMSVAGKQGRCPACSHVFIIPAMMTAIDEDEDDALPDLAPLAADPWGQPGMAPGPGLQPASPLGYPGYPQQQGYPPAQGYPQQQGYPGQAYPAASTPTAPSPFSPGYSGGAATNPYASSAYANAQQQEANADKYNHGFGLEHRAWDSGILGGLALIAVSIIWFVGGLALGIIFYYPPILFIIGIVVLLKGIFAGLMGKG
jgi:hypothetical protein